MTRHSFRSDRGTTAVEYALVLALVAVVSIGAIMALERDSGSALEARGDTAGIPSESNGNLAPPPTVGPVDPGEEGDPGDPPPPAVVHLTSLTAVTDQTTNQWVATVTIVISDAAGAPVAGATCSGSWAPSTGSSQTSDVSDDLGRCVMTQGSMPRTPPADAINQVVFTLTGLSGVVVESWDSGANTDDTSETILKP
jgi:Flp pilus assembly pilin Flp